MALRLPKLPAFPKFSRSPAPKPAKPVQPKPALPRSARHRRGFDRDGPGLLFILAALVVVAVAGARFFGFAPGGEDIAVLPSVPAPATEEQPVAAPPATAAGPQVIVYHSHTSENYRPREPHAQGGEPGDVVQVGRSLVASLDELGLQAQHLTDVHDYPSWGQAFEKASGTVAQVLSQRDNVEAVLDIHRDAIASDVGRAQVTTTVSGASAARILLVVGEADNPRAAANAAFAEALRNRMDANYPGLSRGVRLHPQNFNGHLHPNSLQVFIGDYRYNTLEEAIEAARLFAGVVAEELAERGNNAPPVMQPDNR